MADSLALSLSFHNNQSPFSDQSLDEILRRRDALRDAVPDPKGFKNP